MKNKGVLILASLFILSLVGISFYGGPVTYVFFGTILMIPVMSYLYIFYVIFALKIFQKTDGRDMISGTPSDFYITLQNEGWISFSSLRIIFYSSFSTVSEIDDGAVYELPPQSSILKTTKLLCRYRGEYNVGIEKIVVGDYLGIFSVTYRIREPLSVIVSPAIVHMTDIGGRDNRYDAQYDDPRKRTDPDITVREYSYGDDLRFVNWKATSVMNNLMIRERHGEEKSGILIVMDPGRYHDDAGLYLPAENKVMELVLSLSLYFMENNVPTDVLFMPDDIEKITIRNVADYETLYGSMTGYHFRNDASLKSISDKEETGPLFGGYRMIIVVCQSNRDETDGLLSILNVDNIPVRVYLIGNNEPGNDLFDADRSGRTEFIMTDTRPLSEVNV